MKRSTSFVAVVVELTCLVGLLAAQPAAASSWTAPVRLGGDSSQAGVALLGDDRAAVVWQSESEPTPGIYGAIRSGGTWKPATRLAATAFDPAIAPLGDGRAIAVWTVPRGVEAAIASPGGGWTRLPPIPHTGHAFTPRVAADAAGRATVVWEQPGPHRVTIDVATRAPGGGWSAVKRLSRPGRSAEASHVAVDPSGAAVAVWRRRQGAYSIVQAAVRSGATAGWSAPVDLSTPGENAVSPGIAIDPEGEAVAVWHRFDGSHQIVQASAHPAGGRWTPPVGLSAPGYNAKEARVALSPAGEAIAIWERFDGRVERIQAAVRPPGGGWSEPEDLSGTLGSAHEPRLAIDPDGTAWAVWEGNTAHGSDGRIGEASRPAGGSWSAPEMIEVPELWPDPALAVSTDGEAAVLWSGYSVGVVFRPAAPPSP